MKDKLDRLADQVLTLDDHELAQLLPDIQKRMQHCDHSPEWERSVVAFFLINAMRFKNNAALRCSQAAPPSEERPRLRLVK